MDRLGEGWLSGEDGNALMRGASMMPVILPAEEGVQWRWQRPKGQAFLITWQNQASTQVLSTHHKVIREARGET
eukprot:1142696-Pelagomonas_calceolata.AAC.1